jgi:hypothetical protein
LVGENGRVDKNIASNYMRLSATFTQHSSRQCVRAPPKELLKFSTTICEHF